MQLVLEVDVQHNTAKIWLIWGELKKKLKDLLMIIHLNFKFTKKNMFKAMQT